MDTINSEENFIELIKNLLKFYSVDKLPEDLMEKSIDFFAFRSGFEKESERGCALLAASYLDHLLEIFLFAKMIGTAKQKKELFNFNGPLGTFSNRIRISYSIGLIPKIEFDDLNLIRSIRNEFGHSPSIISFDDTKIKSLCDNLKCVRQDLDNSRSKFSSSVSYICGSLAAREFIATPLVELKNPDIEKMRIEVDQLLESQFTNKNNT